MPKKTKPELLPRNTLLLKNKKRAIRTFLSHTAFYTLSLSIKNSVSEMVSGLIC